MSYLVKKDRIIKKVIDIENIDNGYKFTPKKSLKIKEINVIDPSMIESILTIKFNKVFNKLLNVSIDVINDEDSTSDDTAHVLGEVERLRGILLNKYHRFLTQEKEELFLNRLRYLENELKSKMYMNTNSYENSRGGR